MRARPEKPDDRAAIYAVHAGSFPTDAEARLVDLLRDGGRLCTSLVAEVDGVVVGHAAFSPVNAGEAVGAGLGPLAVTAVFRRRGIADRLVRAGLDASGAAGFAWAVVLGDPRYYARFGFQPAARFGLVDEYGGGEAFQALELAPGGIPVGAGRVRYAPESSVVAELPGSDAV